MLIFTMFSYQVVAGTITSAATGNWSATATWVGGVLPSSSDFVVIAANHNVTVDGTYSCSTLSLGTTNNIAILTFSAVGNLSVSGVVTIGKSSATSRRGTITLVSGATLNAGSLVLGTLATQASTLNMTTGGTLIVNGAITTSGTGAVWNIGTGTVELTANNTLPSSIFTTFNNLIISGGTTTTGVALTAVASLTVKDGATFSLSQAVTATALNMDCGGVLGANISGASTLTLGGNLATTNIATGAIGAAISCPIALSATRTFTVADDGTSASDLSVSSVISGAVGLTKAGLGTLVLSGANTYSGLTTVSLGTLALGNSDVIASGALTVNGGSFQMDGYNETLGTVSLTSGSITSTTGILTGTSYAVASGTISAILAGAVSLTKTTAGTVILSGTNTYSGATSISLGVLNIQNSSALGATSSGTTITSGAALQLQGGISVGAEALSVSGTGIAIDGALRSISGNNTWGGLISLGLATEISSDADLLTLDVASGSAITGTNNLTLDGSGNFAILDPIATGTRAVTKSGLGILTLSGANTYTGLTTVSGGILALGNSNVIATGALTVNGGSFQMDGYSETLGAVTLTSGSITGTTGILTGASYAVASGTITAILAGGVAMTKTTAGTVTLSGANTYSTGTTISLGTLQLGATNAIPSTLVFNGGTFSSGATSGFSETFTTMGLTASSTLALGTGSHTLNFSASNAVTWTSSTVLTITGWLGDYSTAVATGGRIFVGSSAAGLTASQTNQIRFFDGSIYYSASITASGELIPDNNPPTGLSYTANNQFSKNLAITNLTPTVSGYVASYGVSPALPAGLSLNTTTGVISGTPTVCIAPSIYAVTATNAFGSSSFNITISSYLTSAATGNWSTTATWTGGVIPTISDLVIITTANTVTVNGIYTCASLSLGTASGTASLAFATTGSPKLTVSGAVTIGNSGNANRKATITFQSGSTLEAGSLVLGAIATQASTLIMTAGGTLIVNGSITCSTGVTWTRGAGTVQLTANNTLPSSIFTTFNNLIISGGTTTTGVAITTAITALTIKDGATFSLSHAVTVTALNMDCGGLLGASMSGASILTLGGNLTTTDATTGAIGAIISCPISLVSSLSINFTVADDGTSAEDLLVSGIVSGSSSLISKLGLGSLTLSNNNTYSGGTTMNAGTLNINHASGIGSGPLSIYGGTIDNTSGLAVILSNNNAIGFYGNFNFSGSNNLNLGIGAVTLGASLNITANANTLKIGGVINDNTKDFTKSGNGSLAFGNNAVTIANCTISAGSLTSTSNTLSVYGNFINNGSFVHNSGTVALNNGGFISNIDGSSASVFNNLIINNLLNINLSGTLDVTVIGTLTFSNGKITTNASKIILGSSGSAGTVSGAGNNNYIVGNLRRFIPNTVSPMVSFDIGSATAYVPATVKFTGTVSGSGYLDVSTAFALPDLASGLDQAKCINRNWTIDNTNVAGFSSYGVVLNFTAADKLGTPDTLLLQICKYHSPTWTTPSIANRRNTSIECSGLTNFSVFSIGQPINPLPIELLSFQAEDQGSFAKLKWTTTSEKNNNYFTIERSENGLEYAEEGKVDAAGNSIALLNYEFTDEYKRDNRANVIYYRLKQTDFDGRFTYSKIIALKKQNSGASMYPNPCVGISILMTKSNVTLIKVYNAQGISVLDIQNAQADFSYGGQNNQIKIDLTNYPAGIYFVFAWNENNLVYNRSLVKK